MFLAALAETERKAIAKLAMHNREHLVLIRPTGGGLVLHTLKQPRKAPVIDLMEALRKSLQATASPGTGAKKTARKRKAA